MSRSNILRNRVLGKNQELPFLQQIRENNDVKFTKRRRENIDTLTFDGYIYKPTSSVSDIDEAIEKLGRKIENAIRYKISRRSPFKVSLCVYHKFDNTEKTRSEELKETDLLK